MCPKPMNEKQTVPLVHYRVYKGNICAFLVIVEINIVHNSMKSKSASTLTISTSSRHELEGFDAKQYNLFILESAPACPQPHCLRLKSH